MIVIEETSERTPEQFRVLASRAWRDWISDRDGLIRIVDKDIRDEMGSVPADLAAWIKAAKDLPYVFFADGEGVTRWEGPLPASGAAMLKILEENGGE